MKGEYSFPKSPVKVNTVVLAGNRERPLRLFFHAACEQHAIWWAEMLDEAGFDYSIPAIAYWDEAA